MANRWYDLLHVSEKGSPFPVQVNAEIALREDEAFDGVFAYDAFRDAVMLRKTPPWHRGDFKPRQWTDMDDLRATSWLQENGVRVGKGIAADAVQSIAAERSFDSLLEYLDGLEWDGTERIDTWLRDFCGVVDSPYSRAVARKFLCACVARARRPGVKFDTMLILEGDQGLRKSTIFSILGGGFFSETLADIGTKDSREGLRGSWIIELAELDAMSRRDASQFKAFLATREDKYRPPYGRRDVIMPRRCVFAGTYNPDGNGYIKDSTGGRRFWPVEARPVVDGHLDTEGLENVRDQLFAEACVAYENGEELWLSGIEEVAAKTHQDDRIERDVWHEEIATWLKNGSGATTIGEIARDCLGFESSHVTNAIQQRIGKTLRSLGLVPKKFVQDGVATRVYATPENHARGATIFDISKRVLVSTK